jgi:hypothetical protein
MAITKTSIYEFIKKCRAKAQASVRIKYEKLVEESTKEYLEQEGAVFAKQLTIIESALETHNEAVKTLVAMLKDESAWCKHSNWSDLPREARIQSARLDIFGGFTPIGTRLEHVRDEWKAEESRVSESYAALQKYAERHSPSKTIKYLADLGFDLAWFDKPKPPEPTMDTSALFVCGEKGAD